MDSDRGRFVDFEECSSAARGRGEGVKFHPPLSESGGPFSIETIKYCDLLLSAFIKNKEYICFEGSLPGLQGPILGLRGTISDSKGPF